jgi:putative membrane protein
MLYLWVKAFHIIAVIAWMASLMIYPRYKIHQLSSKAGEPLFDTMQGASAKLKRIIMTPMMLVVWGLGLTLIGLNPGILGEPSLHVKLLLVLTLSGFHGYFSAVGKRIDAGNTDASAQRLRMLNEVPFVLMIAIVILIVVKPL